MGRWSIPSRDMLRQSMVCAVVLLTAACVPPPPAPPPSAVQPPTPAPPPPSPPPPPPKCEHLDEKCAATAETRIEIAQTGASFQPPEGWTYAKEEGLSVAVEPAAGAAIAFAPSAGAKPEALWGTFAGLLLRLKVTAVEHRALDWARPQAKWMAGELPVKVWQVEKPSIGWSPQKTDPLMDGQPGALLAAVAEVREGLVVVGAGFLLRSASKELVVSMKSAVESLQLAAPASPADQSEVAQ